MTLVVEDMSSYSRITESWPCHSYWWRGGNDTAEIHKSLRHNHYNRREGNATIPFCRNSSRGGSPSCI